MRRVVLGGVLLAAILAVGACGSSEESSGDEAAAPVEQATTTATTRCRRVSRAKLRDLDTYLTVQGGGRLRDGWAVRSSDYSKVFFIAAEIDGPGLEQAGDVGLWASNRLAPGGLNLAVDGVAQEFSDWQDGDKVDAHVTQSDDGADEARRCAS